MKKILLILPVITSILPFAASAHGGIADSDGSGWGMMSWGNMMSYGGFWGWTGGILHLVWLIVGIFAAVWLWQRINKK